MVRPVLPPMVPAWSRFTLTAEVPSSLYHMETEKLDLDALTMFVSCMPSWAVVSFRELPRGLVPFRSVTAAPPLRVAVAEVLEVTLFSTWVPSTLSKS